MNPQGTWIRRIPGFRRFRVWHSARSPSLNPPRSRSVRGPSASCARSFVPPTRLRLPFRACWIASSLGPASDAPKPPGCLRPAGRRSSPLGVRSRENPPVTSCAIWWIGSPILSPQTIPRYEKSRPTGGSLSQVTVTAESSELVVYAGLNDVLIVSDRDRHSARKSCGYWRWDREPGSGYRYREVYALISKIDEVVLNLRRPMAEELVLDAHSQQAASARGAVPGIQRRIKSTNGDAVTQVVNGRRA